MARRIAAAVALTCVALPAASAAKAGGAKAGACADRSYSYAGLQSDSKAHGVSATVAARTMPSVTAGHVAGWIGVAGTGQDGSFEWLQAGFVAYASDRTARMYYEMKFPGSGPGSSFHEFRADVQPGEKHRFSVLEIAGRDSWWRVSVDGRPVSPPIHLPGSHGAWYPQALGENFNGGSGSCNGYGFEFSDLALAQTNGGRWRPFSAAMTFEDPGYRIVRGGTPTRFLATSL